MINQPVRYTDLFPVNPEDSPRCRKHVQPVLKAQTMPIKTNQQINPPIGQIKNDVDQNSVAEVLKGIDINTLVEELLQKKEETKVKENANEDMKIDKVISFLINYKSKIDQNVNNEETEEVKHVKYKEKGKMKPPTYQNEENMKVKLTEDQESETLKECLATQIAKYMAVRNPRTPKEVLESAKCRKSLRVQIYRQLLEEEKVKTLYLQKRVEASKKKLRKLLVWDE